MPERALTSGRVGSTYLVSSGGGRGAPSGPSTGAGEARLRRGAGNAPGITRIDDLLDQEALDALYRFCLDSTIWIKFDYENGYLAAVMDDGFFCPLLVQIEEELPKALPGIFRDHRHTQMWAFKYDEQTSGGVRMHADFAAVRLCSTRISFTAPTTFTSTKAKRIVASTLRCCMECETNREHGRPNGPLGSSTDGSNSSGARKKLTDESGVVGTLSTRTFLPGRVPGRPKQGLRCHRCEYQRRCKASSSRSRG